MNMTRIVGVSLIVLTVLFFLAIPNPDKTNNMEGSSIDLPWNIKLHADGSTEVFKLRLGMSSLSDAIERFHEPEDIAIYKGNHRQSLEAYFGTISLGPLKAKLIATLEASDDEIHAMLEKATGLALSSGADKKIELSAADKQNALQRKLTGLTFIPKYSGLTADFFKQRLGEPQAWLRLSENAVQYFYPDKGLSIAIDSDGKEVMEYRLPADFKVPEQATLEAVQ